MGTREHVLLVWDPSQRTSGCNRITTKSVSIWGSLALPKLTTFLDAKYRLTLEIALSKLLDLKRSWSTDTTTVGYTTYLECAPQKAREIFIKTTGGPPQHLAAGWKETIVAPAVHAPDADPEMAEGDDQDEGQPSLTPTQVIIENLTHGEGEDC
jgi:hypothetical protein